MSTLAFDCCRCFGVKQADGTLTQPCNTCARVLWAEPSGPRSPWFAGPPLRDGKCESHWNIEDNK